LKGQQDKSIHHNKKTNIMTTSTIILPEIKVGLIFYKNTKTNIKGFLIGFALYNER
jgi:hypothetical protein